MYHDENPFHGITNYPFVGAPTDYPYGPTYAPSMDSAPMINPASNVYWNFQQAQNWMTAPASPTATLSPRSTPRYREIRPRPPHELAPTFPPPMELNKEKQHNQHRGLGRGKHSKRHKQLDQGQVVQSTAKNGRRKVSKVTDMTEKPVRDKEISTAKPPPAPRHNSATQAPHSWSPDYPSNYPEDTFQPPVEALQRALKIQILQSLRVLREIARQFRAFNLELEMIDVWVAEIKEVDTTLIPVPSSTAAQVFVPFESLNFILMECITASGPMRGFIIRNQARELLKYIQTYAEEYHLFQNLRVHLDIGRWIERLGPGKYDEKANDVVLPGGRE